MSANLPLFKQALPPIPSSNSPSFLLKVQTTPRRRASCRNSKAMSSRRARASRNNGDDELTDLVFKLQALLPNSSSCYSTTVPASRIIKETCNYMKRLQSEVDDLSEKLSQILGSLENNGVDVEIRRRLLQQ